MHNLVVCGVFKNEAHILSEWIQHYLQRGVDHIYLVNDNSTDGFEKELRPFSEHVTLFHNDIVTNDVGRQTRIYEKYFRPLLATTKWMSILDLDEFLYSPTGNSFASILTSYEGASQLQIDWLHFGSNGHIHQPISVVSGFTKRSKFLTNVPYYSYKCIFKAHALISFEIHRSTVVGETVHIKYSDETLPPLVINHYTVQSLDFFMAVKATRGDCDNYAPSVGLVRDKPYFDSYDINDVEDMRLFEQNKNTFSFDNAISTTDEVTLVITSCNRPGLLDRTLRSFVSMNTYPIAITYIIDDSGVVGCNDAVVANYKDKLNIRSVYNRKNMGQVESIDKVYSYVRTKWIFHCEEDWAFLKPGFIEKSMKVFSENPGEKIFTVWLRPHSSTSDHPIVKDNLNRGYYEMHRTFLYVHRGVNYIWGGITFNPGLRRTSTCLLFHPYSLRLEKARFGNKEYIDEYIVNRAYREKGYYAMILSEPTGHVDHIGWGDHIPRAWD